MRNSIRRQKKNDKKKAEENLKKKLCKGKEIRVGGGEIFPCPEELGGKKRGLIK